MKKYMGPSKKRKAPSQKGRKSKKVKVDVKEEEDSASEEELTEEKGKVDVTLQEEESAGGYSAIQCTLIARLKVL
jgi:hypothetical protein